jgi:hypothetical protein
MRLLAAVAEAAATTADTRAATMTAVLFMADLPE